MKRRGVLGLFGGAALMGTSGCLSAVVDATTRTSARPAFIMPPVGEWRDSNDGDRPDGTGGRGLRATNHNTTRSNRYTVSTGPAGDLDVGWTVSASQLRSSGGRPPPFGTMESFPTAWNVPRSAGAPEEVRERTEAYLADDPVIGETFVLLVPSIDVPGIDDPGAAVAPADILPTAGGSLPVAGETDNGYKYDLGDDFTRLVGMSAPTPIEGTDVDGIRLFTGDPFELGGITDRPFQERDLPVGGQRLTSASHPVVVRALATLQGDVHLPVLAYAQRLRHDGDWIFVAGWVLDAGGLYDDATTVLIDAGPNRIVPASNTDVRRSDPPEAVVDALDERGRMGSLFFDGPTTPALPSVLPAGVREGDGLSGFADTAVRGSGRGRNPQTGKEIKIAAKRVTRMSDTAEVVARELAGCEDDRCRTLRADHDTIRIAIRNAKARLEAGDDEEALTSLLEARETAERTLQRLVAADQADLAAIPNVPALVRTLLRETAFALGPPTGSGSTIGTESERFELDTDDDGDGVPGSSDGSSTVGIEKITLAVENLIQEVAGDDDGDGWWDGIDQDAAASDVSVDAMQVDGDTVVVGHTVTLKQGRTVVDAMNRTRGTGNDRPDFQDDGPFMLTVVPDETGDHQVAMTVLTHPETGRPLTWRDVVVDRLGGPGIDIGDTPAGVGIVGRALDAFVDTAARLHAGSETEQIDRRMTIASHGGIADDFQSLEPGDYIAALRGEVPAGSAPSTTVVNLDSTLIHLSSEGEDLGDGLNGSWITGPAERPSTTDPIRVLHVDDEPGLAEVTGHLLERENDRFSVTPVTSPEAGRAHLDEHPDEVDCLITDITMPGMNGYELVRSVRETHPDLPVVLFTVTSAAEAWERARAIGATDHIEKGSPDQYVRLADVIERTGG